MERSNAEGTAESIVQRALGAASNGGVSASPTPLQITMALKSVKSWAMRKVVLVRPLEEPPSPAPRTHSSRGFHLGNSAYLVRT